MYLNASAKSDCVSGIGRNNKPRQEKLRTQETQHSGREKRTQNPRKPDKPAAWRISGLAIDTPAELIVSRTPPPSNLRNLPGAVHISMGPLRVATMHCGRSLAAPLGQVSPPATPSQCGQTVGCAQPDCGTWGLDPPPDPAGTVSTGLLWLFPPQKPPRFGFDWFRGISPPKAGTKKWFRLVFFRGESGFDWFKGISPPKAVTKKWFRLVFFRGESGFDVFGARVVSTVLSGESGFDCFFFRAKVVSTGFVPGRSGFDCFFSGRSGVDLVLVVSLGSTILWVWFRVVALNPPAVFAARPQRNPQPFCVFVFGFSLERERLDF